MELCPGYWVDILWCLSGKKAWIRLGRELVLCLVCRAAMYTQLWSFPEWQFYSLQCGERWAAFRSLGNPGSFPAHPLYFSLDCWGSCWSTMNLLANLSLHTHTHHHHHPPPPAPTSYTAHRSYSTSCAEQINFYMASSHHHISLQGCVSHTLIRPPLPVTNKVILFVFMFTFILHCSPQRHSNCDGKTAPATNLLLTTSKQWVCSLSGGLLDGWGKRSLVECPPILNLHLLRLAFFLPIFVLQCFLQVKI